MDVKDVVCTSRSAVGVVFIEKRTPFFNAIFSSKKGQGGLYVCQKNCHGNGELCISTSKTKGSSQRVREEICKIVGIDKDSSLIEAIIAFKKSKNVAITESEVLNYLPVTLLESNDDSTSFGFQFAILLLSALDDGHGIAGYSARNTYKKDRGCFNVASAIAEAITSDKDVHLKMDTYSTQIIQQNFSKKIGNADIAGAAEIVFAQMMEWIGGVRSEEKKALLIKRVMDTSKEFLELL